jgi:hypothetical protein
MLPGGLSVVGLCLVSPAFEPTTAASLTKLASRFSKPYFESACSAFLTMHFSTITGSFTCQCQSVPHNVGFPVEVVIDELHDLWCCLESRVSVRLNKLVQPGKPFGDVQVCFRHGRKLFHARATAGVDCRLELLESGHCCIWKQVWWL